MIKNQSFQDDDFRVAHSCSLPPKIWGCVGVAIGDGVVGVRNTDDPTKVTAVFTPDEWRTFVAAVKQGEFDI